MSRPEPLVHAQTCDRHVAVHARGRVPSRWMFSRATSSGEQPMRRAEALTITCSWVQAKSSAATTIRIRTAGARMAGAKQEAVHSRRRGLHASGAGGGTGGSRSRFDVVTFCLGARSGCVSTVLPGNEDSDEPLELCRRRPPRGSPRWARSSPRSRARRTTTAPSAVRRDDGSRGGRTSLFNPDARGA